MNEPDAVADEARGGPSITAIAVAIFVAGVLLGSYGRYLEPLRPGVTTRGGFYGLGPHGQPDQWFYIRTSRLFAHWHLPRGSGEYRYGLGYPILAVPFIWLGFHGDPFAPVDAIAFGAAVALTFVLGTHLSPFRSQNLTFGFGMAGAVVMAMASPALGIASVPFNTNIVVPLGLLVLVIATSKHEITYPRAVACGLAVGWIFAARYLDAAFLGLPVAALIVCSSSPQRRRLLLGSGAALAVMLALVLGSQQYAFGNFLTTPYHFHNRSGGATNDQSIHEYKLSSVPRNFVTEYITGKDNRGVRQPRDPLMRDFPLLVLMPLGVYTVWRRRGNARAVWLTAIAGSAIGSVFYLSFVAGGGGDLKFDNARYWAPWYPLWSVLAVLGVVTVVTAIANLGRRGGQGRTGASGDEPAPEHKKNGSPEGEPVGRVGFEPT